MIVPPEQMKERQLWRKPQSVIEERTVPEFQETWQKIEWQLRKLAEPVTQDWPHSGGDRTSHALPGFPPMDCVTTLPNSPENLASHFPCPCGRVMWRLR
mgnify:FL=1